MSKTFIIDEEHFQKTLQEGLWANDPIDLLDKLFKPVPGSPKIKEKNEPNPRRNQNLYM